MDAFAASPDPSATPEQTAKQYKIYFEAGDKLFLKEQYLLAYEEYQRSLAAKRTFAGLAQSASCLRELGRYEEALEQYEAALSEFPGTSKENQTKTQVEIASLQSKVGTISIAGDTPLGASVFVDERLRGAVPLSAALRVNVGTHAIRILKDGFPPITATVDVQAGKNAIATLRATPQQGKLEVREKHNWTLHVKLDGKDVGSTPWSGLVNVGDHEVQLHGYMGVDAIAACETPSEVVSVGAKVESTRETATLSLYETTRISLGADVIDASLRVDSKPSGAIVFVDETQMGPSPWEGRLPLGTHRIEVSAQGYVTAKDVVLLEKRKEREISVVLQPGAAAERQRMGRNILIGTAYGVSGLGIGLFGVAGALALSKSTEIKARCPESPHCPISIETQLNEGRRFGDAATAGLVIAGVGAAIGTIALFTIRPDIVTQNNTALIRELRLGFWGSRGLLFDGSF